MKTNREQLSNVCCDCKEQIRHIPVNCNQCPVNLLNQKLGIGELFVEIIARKDMPEGVVFIKSGDSWTIVKNVGKGE